MRLRPFRVVLYIIFCGLGGLLMWQAADPVLNLIFQTGSATLDKAAAPAISLPGKIPGENAKPPQPDPSGSAGQVSTGDHASNGGAAAGTKDPANSTKAGGSGKEASGAGPSSSEPAVVLPRPPGALAVTKDVRTIINPTLYVMFHVALALVGVLLGFLIGSWIANSTERFNARLKELSTQEVIIGGAGGMVIVGVMVPVSNIMKTPNTGYFIAPYIIAILICALVGFQTFLAVKGELMALFVSRVVEHPGPTDAERMKGGKILDTNVIIDGRVADVCRAGFLQGAIYIPGFVLDELQYIADSADNLKRARGRRGLDILNQMRKESKVLARDLDDLITDNAPVDVKLVSLAKHLEADIVTNDYNLNKVAELQGVQVLNINQLANALKPVVMAGEEMTVTIIKEGKEATQGIGYLDDGTMIVVENARRFVNETLDVIVTSVLQTVAGKMIFATLRHEQEQEEELLGRNIRSYSGSGPRRKTRP